MTNREIALEAAATALVRLEKMRAIIAPTLGRYLEADLKTIQDAVTNIQELKRPRKAAKKKAEVPA